MEAGSEPEEAEDERLEAAASPREEPGLIPAAAAAPCGREEELQEALTRQRKKEVDLKLQVEKSGVCFT